jgi:polyhydroxyalkanoate synthase subunit PhaC
MPQSAPGDAAPADSPLESFERMGEVAGKAQQMMLEFWTAEAAKLETLGAAPGSEAVATAGKLTTTLASTFQDWAKAWATTDPAEIARLTTDYWSESLTLWSGMMTGNLEALPAKADKRFQAEAWSENPVFDMVRRSYLLASDYIGRSVESLSGLPPEEHERLQFQARQFVDAMSPANFAALNPEVIAAAQASNGESLISGLQNMLDDLKRGKLTMTDEDAFEVGRNVAATPGKVVFENRLFQLIHYAPTTAQVHEIPLLIFPPWINKFYILDLTAEKSLIRWAVDQGLSVFVVSWAQGSEELADVILDNYVLEGQLTAIDKVLEATGAPATNTIGYCVAGTTLATTLAYMAATGQAEKVKTATYFTAQVDFDHAGDLKTLIDDQMITTIRELSAEKGYLDGRFLATTFNMLRPTDLIWNYVVNNYLKGKEYVPFDLLFWNSDPTNVPGKWHLDYVRDLYHRNLLVEPGGISVAGVPIDLKAVHTPSYIQAGKDDHIAPAISCFKLTKAFSGPHRFMLAGSGHIAGVVNPPSAQKYQHWTLPDGVETPDTLEAFRAAANETRGSWWPDWIRWLAPQSGEQVKARVPGKAKGFAAIEDAPGRYVKQRIA